MAKSPSLCSTIVSNPDRYTELCRLAAVYYGGRGGGGTMAAIFKVESCYSTNGFMLKRWVLP